MPLSGILNVDKPQGWTSFQVVSLVRRLSRVRRVGHAGTLDPLATGVLPVCLGPATRFVEYAQATRKVYQAQICLGATSDSYDAEGAITATGDASAVTRSQAEAALSHFVGEIRQTPPPYSALKRDGVPLYRHARAGRSLEAPERSVTIHRLELLDFSPPLLTVDVECGSGTYIRSLADDLGQSLGCGAYLQGLTRTRVGPFRLEEAVTVGALREAAQHDGWYSLLQAPDVVLSHCYAAILGPQRVKMVRQGKDLQLQETDSQAVSFKDGELCRAYSCDGDLVAVLRYRAESGDWHPAKVLPCPDQ